MAAAAPQRSPPAARGAPRAPAARPAAGRPRRDGSRAVAAVGGATAAALLVGLVGLAHLVAHDAWPPTTLHGTVSDAATGRALAGVRLQLSCAGEEALRSGTTDAEGRYRIEGPPGAPGCVDGTLRIVARGPWPGGTQYGAQVDAVGPGPAVGEHRHDVFLRPIVPVVLAGRVLDAVTGDPIPGATVMVPFTGNGLDQTIRVVAQPANGTDPGAYRILLPDGLPRYFVVSAAANATTHPDYLSSVRVIDLASAVDNQVRRDFLLPRPGPGLVVLDEDLVHLGDDRYGGPINSQFQARTHGTERSWTVELNATFARGATMTFLAKGIQLPPTLEVGNVTIEGPCCSPQDGSWGEMQVFIPRGLLAEGANRLVLRTATNGVDYDDWEFIQVLLEAP